jgi:pSer/pThr/pTyr-binding forkhead associated (FHA) protein
VKHPSVSKEHAFIEFETPNQAFIKDLNSLNGVYLNGIRLQKGNQ